MSQENFKGGFRELDVWKEAREFRKSMSTLAKTFPDSEKYKLTNQIVRASRSISANIAEGYGRYHYQENIQSCRQARGSLMECLDHLICALDEKYINEKTFIEFESHYTKIHKMLNGYIAYLKKRKEED